MNLNILEKFASTIPLKDKLFGDFFGALSFLDGQSRSNIALVSADTDVFVLERTSFDKLGEEHKKLALNLLEAIGRVLGSRLRYGDMALAELRN